MKNLVFAVLIFFTFSASAQIIYVNPKGTDKAAGTENDPTNSLAQAFTFARKIKDKKVIIKVASGNYFVNETLRLTPQDSRSTSSDISVIGDKNNPPVFYGGIKLKAQIDKTTGNWILPVPANKSTALALTINNNLVPIVSTGSNKFYNVGKVDYIKQNDSSLVKIAIPNDLNQTLKDLPKEQWANLYANFYVKWTNVIAKIIDYSYAGAYFQIKVGKIPNHLLIDQKSRYRILNGADKLEKGDWYYKNESTIVYKPRDSDKIEKDDVYYPLLNRFLSIDGGEIKTVDNYYFSNIIFNTGGKKMNGNGFFSHQAAEELEAVIELNYTKNITFDNIQIRNVLSNAIWIKKMNENDRFVNSIVANNGAGSVKVGNAGSKENELTNKVFIENNKIYNGGLIYQSAPGIIILQAKNTTVKNNDIENYGYTGISIGMRHSPLGFPVNNYVGYNSIDNIGRGELDDMAGIYTLGGSDSTTIYNNVITNVKALNYGGHGLYSDGGSKDIILKNNLVFNCSHAGYHANTGYGLQFINNYLINNSVGLESWHFGNGSLVASKNLLLNNLIPENEEWQKILKSSSNNNTIINDFSLKVNSLNSFTNVVNNEFNLKSKGIDKIDFNNVGVLK